MNRPFHTDVFYIVLLHSCPMLKGGIITDENVDPFIFFYEHGRIKGHVIQSIENNVVSDTKRRCSRTLWETIVQIIQHMITSNQYIKKRRYLEVEKIP